MKNLIIISVTILVFCTRVTASDIAFYVGYWNTDGWYDPSQFDDVETIIAETGYLFQDIQLFDDSHLHDFGAWVDERTNDGKMDIIWLNGCIPSVLYPNPNLKPDGSRAEEWLDGGNMIINVGDWFAYCTFEGGIRGADNGADGAANILDLPYWIIVFGDNTQMTVTQTGKKYLPSLNDHLPSDRPVVLSAIQPPWEVAAVFASTGGTEDPTTEISADPVVLHNTETNGYLAIINQGSYGNRMDDRGLTCAEFICNWVNDVIGLDARALPIPADGARIGNRTPVLQWNPREMGTEYDVYFGTDFNRVKNANLWDTFGIYRGRYAEASYATEELEIGRTYYWRIDSITSNGWMIHKGDVSSFTVVDTLTIESQVSLSEDDGYASSDNLQNIDSDYLKVGASGFTQPPYYVCGMLFRYVDIPYGAEIVGAHLKMRAYNNHLTDSVYAKIEAEAKDSAGLLSSFRNLDTLIRTSASVNWDHLEPWAKDTWYESPDIAEVVQEVINGEGWPATGGSLLILYSSREGEGNYRNVSSCDRGSNYAPRLEITYAAQR